ncbi:MAG TPA: polysaccharide biosynthesis/export family protein [Lunatimonas sp.]|nr:polysaccharide biosynthesis/export family protein [Lunatimonas sp.]
MKQYILQVTFLLLLLSSCATRNLIYLSDIDPYSEYQTEMDRRSEIKIRPYDRLKITVNSPSAESNLMFNRGIIRDNTEGINELITQTTEIDQNVYLVNQDGTIEFPILGLINLGGLTLEEARVEMKFLLKSQLKEPSVNILIANFKVSVIGEVNNPANFLVGAERINIFEALGLAGDMTVYGKRENVLILRERDGVSNVYRMNLNEKNVINSPYYYLQQNDIVYVEPHKQKAKNAKVNSTLITIISVSSSVLVAMIFNWQNIFN